MFTINSSLAPYLHSLYSSNWNIIEPPRAVHVPQKTGVLGNPIRTPQRTSFN